MAFIDILILIVTAIGGILGFMKGIIRGAGTVVGALAGIFACHVCGSGAYKLLLRGVPDVAELPGAPYTGTILAYILLFLVVYLAIVILAGILCKAVHAVHLSTLDRVGGAAFGAFKYLLLLSVALNGIYVLSPTLSIFHTSGLLGGDFFKLVMNLAPWVWGLDIFPDLG